MCTDSLIHIVVQQKPTQHYTTIKQRKKLETTVLDHTKLASRKKPGIDFSSHLISWTCLCREKGTHAALPVELVKIKTTGLCKTPTDSESLMIKSLGSLIH